MLDAFIMYPEFFGPALLFSVLGVIMCFIVAKG